MKISKIHLVNSYLIKTKIKIICDWLKQISNQIIVITIKRIVYGRKTTELTKNLFSNFNHTVDNLDFLPKFYFDWYNKKDKSCQLKILIWDT